MIVDPGSQGRPEKGVGLTSSEAADRLGRNGPNVVTEAPVHGGRAFLLKFWGLVPGMLELAIIVDVILGRRLEAVVIFALLSFNAVLGFFQERRARQALALLRQRLTVNARVRRDGRWQTLSASELVPGDMVHLRIGDVVPADIDLIDGQIQVDQSTLTGESLPVTRGAGETAYAGALVRRGEASGVVSATGPRTTYGKTAELVRTAEAPRRIEQLIVGLTKYLAALDIMLAIGVLAATLIRGSSLPGALPFLLMLLVASVPIALPAMFTMSASLGARALAENGILVTRLSAIEDAAAMDVLCLDKTGTLTQNRITVGTIAPRVPRSADDLMRLAALASDDATQDPIDLAILEAARARGLMDDAPPRAAFVPFDPGSKRSEATVRQGDEEVRILKGEPATVAELAGSPWPELADEVARLSADGSRVLAVATGSGPRLELAGLVALGDPPRPDSAALIASLSRRGVRVVLVTGDGEATARAVAATVGIRGEVASAGALHDGVDPQVGSRYAIFAQVFPQDKFNLVKALQATGHVVGMTGDGVNDAPALRQADVGVAVASATDVAKAAASLVLTRPGLGEIVMAIEGSRRIYQRMQTFILTLNTRKIGIPLFLALGVLVLGVYVLNPLLIVLLMFATDFATMSVSTDRAAPSPTPDRWVIRPLMITALGLAALMLLVSAAVYWVASGVMHLGTAETQTAVFLWMVFGGAQAVLYLTRARGFFWVKPHPGRGLLLSTLVDVVAVAVMATQGWLMTSVPPSLVGGLVALSIAFLFAADLLKVGLMRLASAPGLPSPG